ncbi:MAG TPA: UdgX family uracil-DNA binding protein [Candidatus Elarobacter sp.]|nr:UdgX family uracil-DNA binding protein [Candidatus Elarobacter sp.]
MHARRLDAAAASARAAHACAGQFVESVRKRVGTNVRSLAGARGASDGNVRDVTGASAAAFLPADRSLPKLRVAAAGCRGCELWKRGTQTVFGAGPVGARVMFVGEQPGNDEDLAGAPFVGPAGKLLDRALEEAGIDRDTVYVTNAVKHFKWVPRGKRRIHEKPKAREVAACHPWLEAEIEAVRPAVLVCLGATAAQSIIGKSFRVTRERGTFIHSPLGPTVMATIHPSAILRAPDDTRREYARAELVADLKKIARHLATSTRSPAPPAAPPRDRAPAAAPRGRQRATPRTPRRASRVQ